MTRNGNLIMRFMDRLKIRSFFFFSKFLQGYKTKEKRQPSLPLIRSQITMVMPRYQNSGFTISSAGDYNAIRTMLSTVGLDSKQFLDCCSLTGKKRNVKAGEHYHLKVVYLCAAPGCRHFRTVSCAVPKTSISGTVRSQHLLQVAVSVKRYIFHSKIKTFVEIISIF